MREQQTEQLVGKSRAISTVLEDVTYAGASDAKVLVTGESGVGKEIVARLVHKRSRRVNGQFVTLNCAGVPESLLESELFGHVRGSFTGAYRDRAGLLELADGGTLFMDEVGEMSLRMQALLLRFLETGEIQRVGAERRHTHVNVRLVTATNRNLLQQIRAGAFREDLYYRLNVIHIIIPPLRERREDVPLLIRHYLARFAEFYKRPIPDISSDALQRLTEYAWPGNVRELRNVVERLVVRGGDRSITAADIPAEIAAAQPAPIIAVARDKASELYDRLVHERQSFWSAVYEPFMQRDLTRDDLRAVVAKGLQETRGSYTQLIRLFQLAPGDYKRFLNFLHSHGCHVPVRRFKLEHPRPSSPSRFTADATPARPSSPSRFAADATPV
jgi:transcriptional regulator with GAF, ATPase, and Fis domain